MDVGRGALYGLIGPNGAGKTTVFNLLTGVYDPTEGDILLAGRQIDGRQPFEIAKLGVTRTFQNIRLFSDMTVLENVMAARHLRSRQTLADAVLGTPRHHAEERAIARAPSSCSKIFDLDGLADENATSLPYGSQRRLEIARALATEPQVLLLDEPAAGMNPQESQDLMRADPVDARRVRADGPPRRAQHEGRDGDLRNGPGHRPRRDDRHRHAGRDPEEPRGDRGLPWRRLSPASGPILKVEHVDVFYGGIHALRDVSLRSRAGEVVTLIGANGAGKSTTLRAITGLLEPRAGRIELRRRGHHRRCPRTSSCRAACPWCQKDAASSRNLTVLENLEMGAYVIRDKARIKRGPRARFHAVPAA